MKPDSKELLDGAIKALGDSFELREIVEFAYRLGMCDGQAKMTHRAEELLKESTHAIR